MNVAFILTMPGVGSRNGKWSGEGKLFAKVVMLGHAKARELDGKSFHYYWSDGWGARVQCKIVKGAEIRQINKTTQGFCGYEWMIDSIRTHGKIMDDAKIEELKEVKF